MKKITFKTKQHEKWYKWYEYLAHQRFKNHPRPFKHLCKPFSKQEFANLSKEVQEGIWREKSTKLHKI